MLKIIKVYDSRGNATICSCIPKLNLKSYAPAGKSTGKHEVITYPLNKGIPSIEKAFIFFKKHQTDIEKAFQYDEQKEFDNFLKEISNNLQDMGGSLSVSLSLLFLKYKAYKDNKQPYEYLADIFNNKISFPKPLGNVIGGGLHSHNKLPVQEFLVTHLGENVKENIENNLKVYHFLEKEMLKEKIFFGKNDEGAIVAQIGFNKAINLLDKAVNDLGLNTKFGFDFAANSFYKNGNYLFDGQEYTEEKFITVVKEILKNKNIVYIEDPFDEESFGAFAKLQKQTEIMVCGDDLYTTNVQRLKKGLENKSTNTVLVKPNQIGTLSDTIEFVNLAKANNIKTVLSHRSGETCDSVISDIAVGLNLDFIKTGTVSGERLAKLNRLLYIYEQVR